MKTKAAQMTSLSVLVPVYNEQHLVYSSLLGLTVLETSPHLERIEVIVVDDCSTDDTPQVIERFRATHTLTGKIEWIFLTHEKNRGKGSAVRTALDRATCHISVIHDADLEYHPKDLLRIVQAFIDESADAVYGSRFAGGEVRRILHYRHELGNRLLTFLSNVVTNLNVTDMETCYKAIRTTLFKSIPLESNDFRIEPEITIKLAKRNARLFEVPISYSGRTYDEGKKINWRVGFRALGAIVRFAMSDRVYKDDAYGSAILGRLSRAPRFNGWMADTIRGYCGQRVLEIGGGVGNLTRRLVPRAHYVVSDINPLYLDSLQAYAAERPYMQASYCDVTDASSFPVVDDGYDTVVCLNVVEHIADDVAALRNIYNALRPGGTAIILVPHGQWNFGTLDEVLGHYRRYSPASLRKVAERSGFAVRKVFEFNRMGTPAWLLNGRILRRKSFGLVQIWLLNVLTPLFRWLDGILPLPGLSVIAILERPTVITNEGTVVDLTTATASLTDSGVVLGRPATTQ